MRLQFGDCLFDSDARTLECAGESRHVSGKAFQLLHILLEARPNPVRKEELFEKLWPQTFVSEANLASLIKEIRAAIGDDARNPRFIRTAHRFGYAFVAPVSEVAREERPIDSIAVLPFANLSGESNVDYLADGVAESLINALSTVEKLRVTPRATSFRYRGRESELQALRNELGVRALLTGRLRLVAGEIVLHVDLIDLMSESQLWGGQFRKPLADLFALQELLAHEVASHLRIRITGETERRLTKRYTSNNEAYQLYLRGRHHWNRRTLEGIERGIFYFQSAIDTDPQFAPAYSGLADSYIALASRDLFPPTQLYPKAEAAATKAVALDNELAEAHASIGAINEVFRWNGKEAERSFREAVRLNPNYVTARMWFAQALAHRGRFGEALEQLETASENDPLSFMLNTQIASVQYLARNYDAAEVLCDRALDINPHYEPAHFTLGLVHHMRGDAGKARHELEKAHLISKGEPHVEAGLGYLDATSGEIASANSRLQRLFDLAATRHVSPVHYAMIHLGLGDKAHAIEWLEKAIETRSGWLVFLGTEPRFDGLREEPRFRAILQTIGLR